MPGEMMSGEKGGEFSYPHGCVGAEVVQRARVRDERGGDRSGGRLPR